MTDAYVTFIEGKKIKIPDRLLKEIGIRDDERILAVITKRRRMIRLIPTGPDVLKISLTMKELPQTIAAVSNECDQPCHLHCKLSNGQGQFLL